MAWFGGDVSGNLANHPQGSESHPRQPNRIVCVCCQKPDAELRCSRCGVPYCSPECQRASWKSHKASCSSFSAKKDIGEATEHRAVSSSSRARKVLPDLSLEIGGPKLVGWREFFKEKNIMKGREEKVKQHECFALATLQALQRLPYVRKHLPADFKMVPVHGRCVLWVLGARDGIEKRQILTGGWEELFNAIDVGWDVVLIGPEMKEDRGVSHHHGTRVYTFNVTSHEAQLPEFLQDPTFVCAFNTGLGAAATPHMRPWIPTLEQLLSMRKPLLLTCFGPHEAHMETSILRATGAFFSPHQDGAFGYVMEQDKPLSVCNNMFSWVLGSSLEDDFLRMKALPHIDAQLRGVELMNFLMEVKMHLLTLSNPDNSAQSCWSSLMAGSGLTSVVLKSALERDDDGRGGIQTIVRCTMNALATACSSAVVAAVFLQLGGDEALQKFRSWARSTNWTQHEWMRDEVDSYDKDLNASLNTQRARYLASNLALSSDEPEEAISCILKVTSSKVVLRESPEMSARVVGEANRGQDFSVRSHRGLWLNVLSGNLKGWLLIYDDSEIVGNMLSWDVASLE